MRKSSKLPAIIGAVFIIAAGIAVFSVLKGANTTVTVMTAKKDLPAYSFVDSSDLNATAVPSDSVTPNDLTESDFEKQPGHKFVVASPVLSGQRIDKRYIPDSEAGSFAVVLPDERVVAAASTITGIADGTIQAGDVVDLSGGSTDGVSTSSGNISSYDKVLCIAATPSDCEGVLPPGVNLSAAKSDNSTSSDYSNDTITVLLAVPEEDAAAVAGQSVTLSLDPFCRVDDQGYFTSPRASQGPEFLCQVPSDRLAARGPTQDDSTQSGSQAG